MTATIPTTTPTTAPTTSPGMVGRIYRFLRSIPTWVLWGLVILWSIPPPVCS